MSVLGMNIRRTRRSFEEHELSDQVENDLIGCMYQKHPQYSWEAIQKEFAEEIEAERARIRTNRLRYTLLLRWFLRVVTRWFPSLL